jgi:ribosomal protein S18 acetylase RimI-like enzyme
VEFFGELWPTLEPALTSAGFLAEARWPVLATRAAPERPRTMPAEVVLLTGATPAPVLRACLEGAAAAFHEPAASINAPGELERLQEGLASGSLRSAAIFVAGLPVSGASLAGRGSVVELLGVWTSPAQRRLGLARAACAELLHGFFADGGEIAWLTSASEAGHGLYRKLGFVPCGTHLDYADEMAPAGHS